MASFKAGDRIQLATRELSPDDEKNGLYYSYFGGLTGSVDTVYDDGSVCIDVDLEALSAAARDRHLAMQEAERKKWLEGLSGEARNRLTPEQKQLKLSYKILASVKDLEPHKGPKPTTGKKAAKAEEAGGEDASPAAPKGPARAPEPAEASQTVPSAAEQSAEDDDDFAPRRPSAEDLAKAEEDYLKSLRSNP
jgi:hypothetical protein